MSRILILILLLSVSFASSGADFQFDATGVTAVVTPSATTYWMCGCLGTFSGSLLIAHLFETVIDTDGDGVVRWELGEHMQPGGLWTMIDGTAGTITTQSPSVGTVPPRPFPQKAFLRDETGAYSRFVLNHADLPYTDGLYVFWVRPGVGAWTRLIFDRGSADEIPINIKRVMVNLASLESVPGSPAAPPGVEAGDFVVVTDMRASGWTGDRVDQHLAETIGAGAIVFAEVTGHEDDGKMKVRLARIDGTDGDVSVRFETADDTARAGVHYVATSGTAQFRHGELFQTIEIPLIDNQVDAQSAWFRVRLSDPAGATLGTPADIPVVIPDNDGTPSLRIERLEIPEGAAGPREVPVKVTLSHTAPKPVTLEWRAIDQYTFEVRETGVLEFGVGEKEKSIVVHYVADDVYTIGHRIRIAATNIVNATLAQEGRVTVRDDDPVPVMTVLDATVSEAAGIANVTVTFSARFGAPHTFSWYTQDGDASSPQDYTSIQAGQVTLPAGATSVTLSIPIRDDDVREGTESFRVFASDKSAKVTILDDERSSRRRTVRH